MPRSIPSLFLFVLLAAASIGIVPALLTFRQYLPFSGGFHGLPSDRMAPDFELIDGSGKAVHLSDIDGYRYLFFGFSRCQTVCPAHWGELRRLQSHFAGTSAPKIIFISVDSAYDTPQRLRERFVDFGPHFIALTGQAAAVQNVSAQYHILAPQGSAETMHHSATLFLLRPDGRIALIYPNPTDEKTLLADLRRLGF